MSISRTPTYAFQILSMVVLIPALLIDAGDTNRVFTPCSDTTVQKSDGFSFGIAFASRASFFHNNTQLTPCDSRLSLSSSNSQISLFRPKVDEISLLTVNTPNFSPLNIIACKGGCTCRHTRAVARDNYGGYMVAFAGRKYAARSPPAFVANSTYTVTSFTLVFEFKKGRLENLFWKRDGCSKCSGTSNSSFVCLNNQDCAIATNNCKSHGGSVDCSIGIQLAFSGTDKHLAVLNSWYEVENLRQYSLYGLYSNLKDSLTGQYNKIF